MRRIALILWLIAGPVAAQTSSERVFRLAELGPSGVSLEITRAATLPELAKLGFHEGRNLVVDERSGDASAIDRLAQELLLAKPDAFIAIGPDAIRAAALATKTVPIVTFGPDLVQLGYAASFARPGGNVTGVVILTEDLDGKRAALLHEAVPAARRVAALFQPSLPYRQAIERGVRAVGASSGIEVLAFEAEGVDAYPAAFAAMRSAGAQALLITGSPTFNRDAELLARLALSAALPVMCEWADNARSGCLLGYGPNRDELRRRIAHYVARIFRGSTPNELPIEGPTHFELAVNLKTAKQLGLDVPASLLAQADEVIE
jgi:putative tryptophan/tyrosine transport system substrate-binding protein